MQKQSAEVFDSRFAKAKRRKKPRSLPRRKKKSDSISRPGKSASCPRTAPHEPSAREAPSLSPKNSDPRCQTTRRSRPSQAPEFPGPRMNGLRCPGIIRHQVSGIRYQISSDPCLLIPVLWSARQRAAGGGGRDRTTRRRSRTESAVGSGQVLHSFRPALSGGGGRDRTDDLVLAKHALSQLSYAPDQVPGIGNQVGIRSIPIPVF